MQSALFLAAYVGCLEIGRLTTTLHGIALFPPAAGLLLTGLARAPQRRRVPILVGAALASFTGSLVHGDSPLLALALACGHPLAALAGVAVLRTTGEDARWLRTTRHAWFLLVSAMASAGVSATFGVLPTAMTGSAVQAFDQWHLRLATELLGIVIVAPLVLAGRSGLMAAVRGRTVEMAALIVGTAVVTHVFWASSSDPRPALLAPSFVWAAFRFQLAGSLVNLVFEITALASSLAGRGPWGEATTSSQIAVGLWLHIITSATFLLLSMGVLERRRSQMQLTRVLDGVSDGIIVIDAHGLVKTMNRSAAVMFGVPGGEEEGLRATHLLSTSFDAAALAAGGKDFEVMAARRDGRLFPTHVSVTAVPSDDEHHALAVVRDLSHQRATEQSLAMSEAQWRAVLAALPDLVLIHDREGRYLGIHVAPHSTLSIPAEEFLGRRVTDLLSPEDAAPVEAARTRVLATKTAEVVEYRVARNGRLYWLESRIVPLGANRTLSVVRDVTERRHLEEQLRQAQKLEAIGRLAGGVAHDFNNLLTVIGGSTELVLDTLSPSDRNRRPLEEVREATGRATLLTQQLLAFGRRQVLQADVFDLGQVVQGCEQMLRRLIGEHIELACLTAPGVPYVQADRGQIGQVIMNLAVNARDAMPAGGRLTILTDVVTVTDEACRSSRELRPGHFVTLTVRDTGTGISDAVVEHIFEPFFTTKDAGHGTGLGLATVYGIVQQSNGLITVDSRIGEGSTFTVYLPAVSAAIAPTAPESLPSTVERRAVETILLVEDEAAVRDIVFRFLTSSGYRVLTAGSGAEALELLRLHAGPLHLLLTDVVMPGVSGPELAVHVLHRHKNVRVLYMSGYPNDALKAHQVPDDVTGFLQKPFSRQALLDALSDALGEPVADA